MSAGFDEGRRIVKLERELRRLRRWMAVMFLGILALGLVAASEGGKARTPIDRLLAKGETVVDGDLIVTGKTILDGGASVTERIVITAPASSQSGSPERRLSLKVDDKGPGILLVEGESVSLGAAILQGRPSLMLKDSVGTRLLLSDSGK